MAQSGYTPILIYASGTASNVPLAANLTSSASGAELALNYADGKLYFKNSSGVVTLLAAVGGSGIVAGSNTQIQFNNSGVFGASANLTWDGSKVTASAYQTGGNLTFTGTGNRITGDFSNATVANRVMFQTSTVNGGTRLGQLPNGTASSSGWEAYSGPSTDLANASFGSLVAAGTTDIRISSDRTGTGTYLPMTFYTGGSERMRLDTSGNVGIGTSSPGYKLDVNGGIRMPNATVFWMNNSSGVAKETLQLYSDNNTYFSTPGALIMRTNGTTEAARIDTSGNVGIGVTPSYKLDVSGVIKGTGNVIAGDGSAFVFGTGTTSYLGGSSTSNVLTFTTTSTERMRIDSSGNVGIGTSSPATYGRFAVVSGGDYAPAATFISNSSAVNWARADWKNVNVAYSGIIYQDSSGLFNIRNDGANAIAFLTNAVERMRIDSSGNVGIGTSSPASLLHVDNGLITTQRYGSAGAIVLRSAAGTQASPTAIASSTGIGTFVARAYDGSAYRDTGAIQFWSDGAVSSTSSPGFIIFNTTPSGSVALTERMRIDSSGNLLVGTTTAGAKLTVAGNAATPTSAVTFSATAMTLNCALSNVFTTTFTANVTTAPTLSNPADGQTLNWFITQDATGTRTMTWPTSFKWPGGTAGVLSTAANSVDLLVATYRSATGFWYATLSKGFA